MFFIGTAFFIHRYSIIEGQDLDSGLALIWNKYVATMASYPYATVNAANLHYALGWNFVPHSTRVGPVTIHQLSWVLLCGVLIYSAAVYSRGARVRLECSGLVALLTVVGFFAVAPKMHERYLHPAITLSLLCCVIHRDRRLLLIAMLASVVNYLNTAYTLGLMLADEHRPAEGYALHIAAWLGVALLAATMSVAWSVLCTGSLLRAQTVDPDSAIAGPAREGKGSHGRRDKTAKPR